MREQILAGNFDMSIPRVLEIIDLKNLKLVRGACLIMKDFMEQVYEIEKGDGGILGHLCKHASIDVMKYISQKIRSENKEVKCVSGFQVVNDHSGNEDRMIEVINTFAQHGMDGINELKEKQYFLHHCLNKNYFKVVDFLIESGQLNAATFEYNQGSWEKLCTDEKRREGLIAQRDKVCVKKESEKSEEPGKEETKSKRQRKREKEKAKKGNAAAAPKIEQINQNEPASQKEEESASVSEHNPEEIMEEDEDLQELEKQLKALEQERDVAIAKAEKAEEEKDECLQKITELEAEKAEHNAENDELMKQIEAQKNKNQGLQDELDCTQQQFDDLQSERMDLAKVVD